MDCLKEKIDNTAMSTTRSRCSGAHCSGQGNRRWESAMSIGDREGLEKGKRAKREEEISEGITRKASTWFSPEGAHAFHSHLLVCVDSAKG